MVDNIDLPAEGVEKAGYLDIEIDPTLDLFQEIEKLKKELLLIRAVDMGECFFNPYCKVK